MTTQPTPPDPTSVEDAELQREIDAALADAPELSPPAPPPEAAAREAPPEIHHEFRRGRIAAIRGDDVFVELAGEDAKMQGIVPLRQFDRPPRLGSIMDFIVDHVDEKEGLIYLSREGAVSRATWEQLTRGAIVEARAVATNKGGLDLEMIGGIRAFMPASQIDLHHVDHLEQFVGQKLEAVVQEIDRKSKRVVLSCRELLAQRQAQAKQKTLSELAVGQLREGKVTNLAKFGAFVDLGGVDGLIHVTDMSYTHVDKPEDVVQPGQVVQVKVLKIDTEKGRISLGLKQVQPDPWTDIADRLRAGDQVSGTVVRTAGFGAFVQVLPGVEGLLPISEMSWKRIDKPEDAVRVSEVVVLRVLSIEPAKRRLSLSLKQAQGDPWIGAERTYARHSVVPGKVIATTDFGAFVELAAGVEGLVHISELSQQHVKQVTDVLKVGDEKQFRVLEVDEDQRKIKLSLKQVEHLTEAGAPSGGPAKPPLGRGLGAERQAAQAAKRKKPGNLKGGMDVGGIGLGGLRLDDIK